MNDVLDTMGKHRSVRSYLDTRVSQQELEQIIEIAQMASTSNFIQAYSVIQVEDKNKRKKLAQYSGNQSYIEEAPIFLVFCADIFRIKKMGEIKGITIDSSTVESFLLPTIDTTLFAQNIMLAAESKGLGGVYIGGIRNNPEKVSQILELPELVIPLFGMCLGYPKDIPEQKPRLPLSVVLHKDAYQRENLKEINQYDQMIEAYYLRRTNGQRKSSWSEQAAILFSKPQRANFKKLILNKGFLLE